MTYNSSFKSNVFSNLESSVSLQIQDHTSILTISGSSVDYTPDKGSDYVVYEFTFLQEYNNNVTINVNYYLQSGSVGGSFSEVEGCIANLGMQSGASKDLKSLTFIVPSWDGPKSLRLTTDAYAVDRDVNLHQTEVWDGSSAQKLFFPSLVVYSVRNVN